MLTGSIGMLPSASIGESVSYLTVETTPVIFMYFLFELSKLTLGSGFLPPCGRFYCPDPANCLGSQGPGLYEPIHGSAPDIAGQVWIFFVFSVCLLEFNIEIFTRSTYDSKWEIIHQPKACVESSALKSVKHVASRTRQILLLKFWAQQCFYGMPWEKKMLPRGLRLQWWALLTRVSALVILCLLAWYFSFPQRFYYDLSVLEGWLFVVLPSKFICMTCSWGCTMNLPLVCFCDRNTLGARKWEILCLKH